MKLIIGKVIGLPFLFVFMNLGFFLFSPEIFTQLSILLPILLLFVFISIDILIRPISAEKDAFQRLILIISFLIFPIFLYLPYVEFSYWENSLFMSNIYCYLLILGNFLLFSGGTILFCSRLQLGKFGGPKLVIETDHILIQTGFYRFIRHPMYLGFLCLFLGYNIAVGGLFVAFLGTCFFFLLFRYRMIIEENQLLEEFGNEYSVYKNRTKRLIPFLY